MIRTNFILLIFAAFSLAIQAEAQVLDRVVAVVNDEVVLQSDDLALQQKLRKSGAVDEVLILDGDIQSLENDSEKRLNYLIVEKIMDSEIKRLNLSVTIDRVEQEVREIAKRNGMSKNDMLSAIKNQGISISEYQDFVKTKIERQSLIESEIASKVRIGDEEVLGYYMRTNAGSEAGVYEYSLAHIFFNPKKGGAQAAQERAQAVYAKLKSGGNFDELAENNSEDTNFSTGGILGTFKAGEFSKEFEGAVRDLKIGEFSSPVPSRSGLHILRVVGKKMVTDPKFEAQKEKIRSQLSEKAFKKHFENWINQKREESYVRINRS